MADIDFIIPATGNTTNQVLKINLDMINAAVGDGGRFFVLTGNNTSTGFNIFATESFTEFRGTTGFISQQDTTSRADVYVLYGDTTDAATTVELTRDGIAASAPFSNCIPLNNDTAQAFTIVLCAKAGTSPDSYTLSRQCVVSTDGFTSSLQGSVQTVGTDTGSAGLSTVSVTISADASYNVLNVSVNGVVGTDIRWTAFVTSVSAKKS